MIGLGYLGSMGTVGGSRGVKFTPYIPAAQYAGGQPGAWYDPSDYTTLSQDSAGTTPVTAVAQPVGRMLDKSGRGNTILQATSTARPLQSARVNLLLSSENVLAADWLTEGYISAAPVITAGNRIAFPAVAGATGQRSIVYQTLNSLTASTTYTNSVTLRGEVGGEIVWISCTPNGTAYSRTQCTLTTAFQTFVMQFTANSVAQYVLIGVDLRDASQTAKPAQNIFVGTAQVERGTVATRYQRVNTASDYDVVGFPQCQTFDGVNSGLATGLITLGANMDCFIAVRRATAANLVLLHALNNGSTYISHAVVGGTAAASSGSGTPTYAVNGVNLNGGAVGTTNGQLDTALPIGAWQVIEIRNANLSTWTALNISGYTSFMLNGDIAGIILAPAGDATARQKNRQYLGAKVGLSLP